MTAGGVATVETLWAELARAKEEARISDAAALKAVKELRAEQAAHRRSEEKIAQMATELEDAANRRELLEKENQAKAAGLKKAPAKHYFEEVLEGARLIEAQCSKSAIFE